MKGNVYSNLMGYHTDITRSQRSGPFILSHSSAPVKKKRYVHQEEDYRYPSVVIRETNLAHLDPTQPMIHLLQDRTQLEYWH